MMFLAQPLLLSNSMTFFSELLNILADFLFQHTLGNKCFLLEEVFFKIQKIIARGTTRGRSFCSIFEQQAAGV